MAEAFSQSADLGVIGFYCVATVECERFASIRLSSSLPPSTVLFHERRALWWLVLVLATDSLGPAPSLGL